MPARPLPAARRGRPRRRRVRRPRRGRPAAARLATPGRRGARGAVAGRRALGRSRLVALALAARLAAAAPAARARAPTHDRAGARPSRRPRRRPPTRLVAVRGASTATRARRSRRARARRRRASGAAPRAFALAASAARELVTRLGAALRADEPARSAPGARAALTVRLYRPDGQWLMYGVDPGAHPGPGGDPAAAAVPDRLGRATSGRCSSSRRSSTTASPTSRTRSASSTRSRCATGRRSGSSTCTPPRRPPRPPSSAACSSRTPRAAASTCSTARAAACSGAARPQGEIESSPVVDGGVDYLGDWSGHVYALDLRTRRFRWIYDDGCKITASATSPAARVYIGDYCGRIVALDRANGQAALERARPGAPSTAPRRSPTAGSSSPRATPARSTRSRQRPLPLGRADRRHRLLGPRRLARPRLLRLLRRRRSTASRPRPAQVLWELPVGGRISGSADGRRRRRLRRQLRPPRSSAPTRAAATSSSASPTASTSPSRATAAGCCSTAGRPSGRSSRALSAAARRGAPGRLRRG